VPRTTWFRLPEARRQAILTAAEAEFGARGFSRGSLNVIARDAGVSKGSLFQYFADKADLCTYLSELASQRIRADIEQVIAEQRWTENFFDALQNTCCYWMSYFAGHPTERALAAAITLELDPGTRAPVRAAVNAHYIAVFRPLLRSAQEAGQLHPEADLEVFLALLMLLLPHLAIAPNQPGLDAVLGLQSDDPGDAEKVVERIIAGLRGGFAPR
jgi:AcrR family transcriptional regulator